MEDTMVTRPCTCPHKAQRSRSSGLSLGYLRSRLPWRSVIQTTWTYVLVLLVITNFCASQSITTKGSIPSLTPVGFSTFRYLDTDHDSFAVNYQHLSIQNDNLYIGAMNYVIWMRADNITQRISLYATKRLNESNYFRDLKEICRSTHMTTADYDCQNHIKWILPRDDGKLEICGTGAYTPKRFVLKPNELNKDVQTLYEEDSSRGLGLCPPNPEDSCTVVYVKSGNPGNVAMTYTGTMMDFSQTHPVFYRPEIVGHSTLLRTEKSDTKWLNEPVFVKSFDVGDYVYLFLRESAIEYMNCGKAIYSRIARVCKSDRGGNKVLESRFTTYFKVRLNCSIPGDYPFYFNELYDVFRIKEQNFDRFYGVFRTNHMGLSGSAVCAFLDEDIQKAFEGPFKEQTETTTIWMRVPEARVPHPRPGECSEDSQTIEDNVLQFSKARPLMDMAVSLEYGRPVFFRQDVMYSKLVIDKVGRYDVYFVVTESAEIHKIVAWHDNGMYESKTITTWKQFTTNDLPINQIQLHRRFLYMSTVHEVLQVPVQQCSEYRYCTQCIQDPYCGWDTVERKCREFEAQSSLLQDVTEQTPVNTCAFACKPEMKKHKVNVPGDTIHLNCSSHCEPSSDVRWMYNDNEEVVIDEKKYFLTQKNSLIVFNVTRVDAGIYKCMTSNVELHAHQLNVIDCDDPESCWRLEFKNWCEEFDSYKKEFDQWQCLKDECTGNDQCIPKQNADACTLA